MVLRSMVRRPIRAYTLQANGPRADCPPANGGANEKNRPGTHDMNAGRISDGSPPGGHRRRDGLARLWNRMVDGLAALGTVLIGVLMLIICADVVARNLLGSSLPLVSELGALTLVMIVYLQFATTVRHDRLARTDLFFTGFRERHPRAGLLLGALFDLAGAAMCALIAWSTLTIIGKDMRSQEYIGVTGVATVPTYPFRILILVGIAVAALQFALQVIAALRAASRTSAKPAGERP